MVIQVSLTSCKSSACLLHMIIPFYYSLNSHGQKMNLLTCKMKIKNYKFNNHYLPHNQDSAHSCGFEFFRLKLISNQLPDLP